MTAKQAYEGVLVELHKAQAPNLLLEDFNYFFNKAINQYINKRYNVYDTSEQTTDDMRVLKSSAILRPIRTPKEKMAKLQTMADSESYCGNVVAPGSIFGATYDFNLPADYLHLLNCICIYKVNKRYKCYDAGTYWQQGATRLTADLWPQVINNFYLRPSYRNPYYYIHNINRSVEVMGREDILKNNNLNPTNPMYKDTSTKTSIQRTGTDVNDDEEIVRLDDTGQPKRVEYAIQLNNTDDNFARTIKLNDLSGNQEDDDVVERLAGHRYGNASNVRLEIRYGKRFIYDFKFNLDHK